MRNKAAGYRGIVNHHQIISMEKDELAFVIGLRLTESGAACPLRRHAPLNVAGVTWCGEACDFERLPRSWLVISPFRLGGKLQSCLPFPWQSGFHWDIWIIGIP